MDIKIRNHQDVQFINKNRKIEDLQYAHYLP